MPIRATLIIVPVDIDIFFDSLIFTILRFFDQKATKTESFQTRQDFSGDRWLKA